MNLFPSLPGAMRLQSRQQRMKAWTIVAECRRPLWYKATLVSLICGLIAVRVCLSYQGSQFIGEGVRAVLISDLAGLIALYGSFRLLFFRKVEKAAEELFGETPAETE